MSIYFKFNPEKAVEAAAEFLKLRGKRPMKYLGLIKQLYTADRIAFERLDQPITGDSYVSMKYGPVLSNVYDLIKGLGDESDRDIWSKYIKTLHDDYKVFLKGDPGINNLCRAELKIIHEVYEKVGHLDDFELAEKTHKEFPEWQNPLPNAKVLPIHVEEILKNVGKSDEEIEEIQKKVEKEDYLDYLLNV